jgi:hypothetical protein
MMTPDTIPTPEATGVRQPVIAGQDAAHAEGGEKRRHDADAEDARAAVIPSAEIVADVVVAEDVAGDEHHQEEQQAEGGDGGVDEHGTPVTLHPYGRGGQGGRAGASGAEQGERGRAGSEPLLAPRNL